MKRINVFRNIYDSFNYKNCTPREFPYIIDIELTNNCNLSCNMCATNLMTRKKGFMAEKTFNKIINECKDTDVAIRFIRYGESTLHPNFLKFSKKVKDNKIPLHITTNGLLLNDKIIKHLIDIELDSLIFSMQGVNKRGYDRMRGEHYNELLPNILKFVEMRGNKDKPYIHISSTILGDSKKDVEEFINYWSKIVDSVDVGMTNLSRFGEKDSMNKEYKPCKESKHKLSIDWDGKITACCADYDNLMVIGDINKQTIHEVWNNNPLLESYRCILDSMQHRCLTLCKDCYPAYGVIF